MAAIAAPSSRAFSRGGGVEYGGRVETNIFIYFKKKPRLHKLERSEWLMRPTHAVLGFSQGRVRILPSTHFILFLFGLYFFMRLFIMN